MGQQEKEGAEKRKANDTLEKTMLQWAKGDAVLLQHTLTRAWGEIVAEERKVKEKKRMKEVHDAKMKSLLLKWESGNIDFLKRCTFGSWQEVWSTARDERLQGKRGKEQQEKEAEEKRKANDTLEKTMLQWAKGDAVLLQHTLTRAWGEIVAEERKIKEKKRMKEVHDAKMKSLLLKWESGNIDFLKRCTFGSWQEVW